MMRLDLVLQRRFLMTLPLLVLGACGGSSELEQNHSDFTVAGVIQNWSRGAEYEVQVRSLLNLDRPAIASAAIDATGRFQVVLPPESTMNAFATTVSAASTQPGMGLQGCSSDVTYSQPTLRFYSASMRAASTADPSGIWLFQVIKSPGSSDRTLVGYTYVDRDFSEIGTVTCISGVNKNIYHRNATYKRGWNTVLSTSQTSGTTSTYTLSVGAATANAVWTDSPLL